MDGPPLTFSIIICSCDHTSDLLATLESIRRTEVPNGMTGELIVVDNSRTDENRRALSEQFDPIPELPLRVLHQTRRGKGYALNVGIAASRGEVLLFTDTDIRVPAGWVWGMTHSILTGRADAVAGGVHLAPELCRPWMQGQHRAWMADTSVLNQQQPEALIGANMALARRVFERVPMFDPELGPGSDLGSCEESLYSLQLREAGYRIVGAFHTSVEHHFDSSRLTRQSFLSRARIEGRCAAYIAHHWKHEIVKHPRWELLLLWCKVWLQRWPERACWPFAEGLPLREMNRRSRLHFVQQYLRERGRARKYSKHGLVKLAPQNSASVSAGSI